MGDFNVLGDSLKERTLEAATHDAGALRAAMTTKLGHGGSHIFQTLRNDVHGTLEAGASNATSTAVVYAADPTVPSRQATVLNNKLTM